MDDALKPDDSAEGYRFDGPAFGDGEEPPAAPGASDMLELLPYLSPQERFELDALLTPRGKHIWMPQAGPQSLAADSMADLLYYGGSAGGGKTDLVCGLALTRHERSIIFRRQAVDLVGIEERITELLGGRAGYSSDDGIWRLPDIPGLEPGRTIELGGVPDVHSWKKYQGRGHDLICFDEVPHFLEVQVRTLMGWRRSGKINVRQRVLLVGNPPTDAEGEWIIRMFAPWLDPQHPNPALPGELRWYVTDEDGDDREVPDSRPVRVGKRWVNPLSRTFIPSRVVDNLYYHVTGYDDVLSALPEPLRSQMRDGNFAAGRKDAVWQAIPTEWIKAAQARWRPKQGGDKGRMTRMGFDPARGGTDKSALARRHGQWFDELLEAPAGAVVDGPTAAAFCVQHIRDGATMPTDSIGIGSSAFDFCKGVGLNIVSFNASEGCEGATDKAGNLLFRNRRARAHWRLREALDPVNPDPIALPPDPELLADLAAVRYRVITMGMKAALIMRSKDEIREVLGRSPNKGDAVVMTFDDAVRDGGTTLDYEAWQRKMGYTQPKSNIVRGGRSQWVTK